MSHSFSRLALPGVALAKEGVQCSMSPFREFRLGVLNIGCAVSVSCDWCSLVGSFFLCDNPEDSLPTKLSVGRQWCAWPRAVGWAGSPQVQEGSG